MAKPTKKPRKRAPRKGEGRPRIEINKTELEKLGALGCTIPEAAGFLECSERTLVGRLETDEYRDIWEQGQCKGKVSLRRTQMKLADKNATMAIFLGKQMLGQKDESRVAHVGPENGPVEIRDVTPQDMRELAAGLRRGFEKGQ